MGIPAPPLKRGDTFGCWVVVRASTPDAHGRARYLCRTTCCGQERVRPRHTIVVSSTPTCRRCQAVVRAAR